MKITLKSALILVTLSAISSFNYAEPLEIRSTEYLQVINLLESRCSELPIIGIPKTLHESFCSYRLETNLMVRYCLFYHMKSASNDLEITFQSPKYAGYKEVGDVFINMNCKHLVIDDWLATYLDSLKPVASEISGPEPAHKQYDE